MGFQPTNPSTLGCEAVSLRLWKRNLLTENLSLDFLLHKTKGNFSSFSLRFHKLRRADSEYVNDYTLAFKSETSSLNNTAFYIPDPFLTNTSDVSTKFQTPELLLRSPKQLLLHTSYLLSKSNLSEFYL